MSGVTTSQRSRRSSPAGRRTFAWLNIAVAFSSTSKTSTATAGAPIAATAAHLIAVEIRISIGWNRVPVVTSTSRSEWCTRWSRQRAGTAWKVTCWK